jgi:hypothetical protein
MLLHDVHRSTNSHISAHTQRAEGRYVLCRSTLFLMLNGKRERSIDVMILVYITRFRLEWTKFKQNEIPFYVEL